MAVTSSREIVPRGFSHRFGESPTAELRYMVTLDDPATTHQTMLNSVGIAHGTAHPEYSYLYCVSGEIQENTPDPYHATITYRYEAIPGGSAGFTADPISRADVWSFSTSSFAAAAYHYYDTDGSLKPLTATNGERILGAMYDESELRATISGNRSLFPLTAAIAVTGALNDATYATGAKHTWKCVGISGQQAVEVVNAVEVRYWQITVELAYRKLGWPLRLPNVGTYYKSGSNVFAVYVRDKATGEDVSTTVPQPLDANGGLKYTGGAIGDPEVLIRRVNPEAAFSTYFGTPPSSLFL
jgi:hypothetical protein